MGTAQCRGTRFISGQKFIRVHNVLNGSGAYPGAGLRSIPVNGSKSAKSMTNNLPLLAVLGARSKFETVMVAEICLKMGFLCLYEVSITKQRVLLIF